MNFLAMVYNRTRQQKYLDGFKRGLNMLFEAERKNGGWSQYWPLTGNGSYQDDITFNDNLMVHVINMLRDIYVNSGEYYELLDMNTREKYGRSFYDTVKKYRPVMHYVYVEVSDLDILKSRRPEIACKGGSIFEDMVYKMEFPRPDEYDVLDTYQDLSVEGTDTVAERMYGVCTV
jgi:hypothetical protein